MFDTRASWKFFLLIIFIFINVICIIFYIFTFRYNVYLKSQVSSSSRVFIFSSDNRPIVNNPNAYYTLSALINYVYARRYQYTFRYFLITYNDTRNLKKHYSLRPSCFNQVLNQERSVQWAKLQVIWHVLETYSSSHDLFLYIDTDAVVNDHNTSLSTFITNLSWVTPSKCQNFNKNSSHLAFPYDRWNKNDTFCLPNSGILVFQPTVQFRRFIQLWWHLNMHESNLFRLYEQDNLWNLLENLPSLVAPRPTADQLAARQEWNTRVKNIFHQQNLTKHIGILNMTTFGNTDPSQFFVHMTTATGKHNRQPELLRIWQRIGDTMNQSQLLMEIDKQFVVKFDTTNDRIPWN